MRKLEQIENEHERVRDGELSTGGKRKAESEQQPVHSVNILDELHICVCESKIELNYLYWCV